MNKSHIIALAASLNLAGSMTIQDESHRIKKPKKVNPQGLVRMRRMQRLCDQCYEQLMRQIEKEMSEWIQRNGLPPE